MACGVRSLSSSQWSFCLARAIIRRLENAIDEMRLKLERSLPLLARLVTIMLRIRVLITSFYRSGGYESHSSEVNEVV